MPLIERARFNSLLQLYSTIFFNIETIKKNIQKRKAISIKQRFKIFDRDCFTCQYCGRKPPQVILHLDHIHPKSKEGTDDDINLVTSCRDCNLGKRDNILKNPDRVGKVKYELEQLKEAEQQIQEYYKYLKKIKDHKENNPIIDLLNETWEEASGNTQSFNAHGKKDLKALIRKYEAEDIIKAIKIAWEKDLDDDSARYKYMIGVLKNLKLERENPELAEKKRNFYSNFYNLKKHWEAQPKGGGYLPIWEVQKWLEIYDVDEIKQVMNEAKGYWEDLKNSMEQKIVDEIAEQSN